MYDLNVSSEPRIKMGILESTSQWMANVIRAHHKHYLISNTEFMKCMININPLSNLPTLMFILP